MPDPSSPEDSSALDRYAQEAALRRAKDRERAERHSAWDAATNHFYKLGLFELSGDSDQDLGSLVALWPEAIEGVRSLASLRGVSAPSFLDECSKWVVTGHGFVKSIRDEVFRILRATLVDQTVDEVRLFNALKQLRTHLPTGEEDAAERLVLGFFMKLAGAAGRVEHRGVSSSSGDRERRKLEAVVRGRRIDEEKVRAIMKLIDQIRVYPSGSWLRHEEIKATGLSWSTVRYWKKSLSSEGWKHPSGGALSFGRDALLQRIAASYTPR